MSIVFRSPCLVIFLNSSNSTSTSPYTVSGFFERERGEESCASGSECRATAEELDPRRCLSDSPANRSFLTNALISGWRIRTSGTVERVCCMPSIAPSSRLRLGSIGVPEPDCETDDPDGSAAVTGCGRSYDRLAAGSLRVSFAAEIDEEDEVAWLVALEPVPQPPIGERKLPPVVAETAR